MSNFPAEWDVVVRLSIALGTGFIIGAHREWEQKVGFFFFFYKK
jgi:uncharacterized membrane protein YhiD involved in acid resistance